MSKLQSLYFKLNPDNPKHRYIIDFFNEQTEVSKVDLLYFLCQEFDILAKAMYKR